jgi:predicted mannosyl-3-phosphoglycerate phosphatase (HAD superfamily)
VQPLNTETKKTVVFSDLDGTLLSSKYAVNETHGFVSRLIGMGVPIIFVDSKTRKEIEIHETNYT